jgi:hypothetical protein
MLNEVIWKKTPLDNKYSFDVNAESVGLQAHTAGITLSFATERQIASGETEDYAKIGFYIDQSGDNSEVMLWEDAGGNSRCFTLYDGKNLRRDEFASLTTYGSSFELTLEPGEGIDGFDYKLSIQRNEIIMKIPDDTVITLKSKTNVEDSKREPVIMDTTASHGVGYIGSRLKAVGASEIRLTANYISMTDTDDSADGTFGRIYNGIRLDEVYSFELASIKTEFPFGEHTHSQITAECEPAEVSITLQTVERTEKNADEIITLEFSEMYARLEAEIKKAMSGNDTIFYPLYLRPFIFMLDHLGASIAGLVITAFFAVMRLTVKINVKTKEDNK